VRKTILASCLGEGSLKMKEATERVAPFDGQAVDRW
jgi:hypothetical protein